MNETLLLVWACIAIVGIIGIIVVKLYYSDKDDEKKDFSNITTQNPLQEMISEKKKENKHTNPVSDYFSKQDEPEITLRKEGAQSKNFDPYIVPETNKNEIPNRNISYSSQNQVLINYDDNVQKFQEPITETQRDIMNKNNNEDRNSDVSFTKTSESKHELKDLFTIDELIKESKRKDDEREKESKTIKKEEEDNSDIKESIKKNQEAKEDEIKDINDIKSSIEKMHEIAEAIKASNNDNSSTEAVASQKDIDEAIDSASNEIEEEITEISETNSITDAVIKKESEDNTVQETLDIKEESTPEVEEKAEIIDEEVPKETESIAEAIPESEEIKTPTLKSPTKVEEDSVSILSGADEDYEFGASIDSSNLFEDENGELSDLDYRKDLAKITNSIKNSGIVKDLREKLAPESSSDELDDLNEDFIRNVNSYTEEAYEVYDDYDDYAPIINETHVDYVEPTEDEIRQENTRRVFENAKSNASIDNIVENEGLPKPKAIPEKSSLKVIINNNEEVLRKGDEIIYTHEGESYSSKVYSINGDDIKVKYRRQDITIKPSDIKKIY